MGQIYFQGNIKSFWAAAWRNKLRDVEKARGALWAAADFLEAADIRYSLCFGTLLGAYRDGDIIPHDTDIDVAILGAGEVRKFNEAVARGDLLKYGFQKDRNTAAAIYGDIYADFYPFEDGSDAEGYGWDKYRVGPELLPLGEIEMRGRVFPCYNNVEQYLVRRYGPKWKTPIQDKHAQI